MLEQVPDSPEQASPKTSLPDVTKDATSSSKSALAAMLQEASSQTLTGTHMMRTLDVAALSMPLKSKHDVMLASLKAVDMKAVKKTEAHLQAALATAHKIHKLLSESYGDSTPTESQTTASGKPAPEVAVGTSLIPLDTVVPETKLMQVNMGCGTFDFDCHARKGREIARKIEEEGRRALQEADEKLKETGQKAEEKLRETGEKVEEAARQVAEKTSKVEAAGKEALRKGEELFNKGVEQAEKEVRHKIEEAKKAALFLEKSIEFTNVLRKMFNSFKSTMKCIWNKLGSLSGGNFVSGGGGLEATKAMDKFVEMMDKLMGLMSEPWAKKAARKLMGGDIDEATLRHLMKDILTHLDEIGRDIPGSDCVEDLMQETLSKMFHLKNLPPLENEAAHANLDISPEQQEKDMKEIKAKSKKGFKVAEKPLFKNCILK
jgi:hypothetical protein